MQAISLPISAMVDANKYGMRINEITSPDDQPTRIKLRGTPKSPDGKQEPSPAAKWVDEVYSKLPKNPLNPDQVAMLFGEGEDQQIALFELEPTKLDPNTVNVKWFQAYPQRQGVGRKALAQLQDMAREAGLKLNLTSWKHGKVPERVLNRFYKSMGFKPGARGMGGLTWDPTVDEGEVIPFARPTLKADTQNLHLAREIASELFWRQSSSYGTAEEQAAERDLEDQLAKIGYRAEWDLDDPEFNMVITHITSGKQYRMGEDELVGESWSNRYKRSIDCSNPKGFSQKAHCAARRKRAAGGHTKSKPVREDAAQDQEAKLGKLLADVADAFRGRHPWDALEFMTDAGVTINDSPAIKALVDANIHQLAGMVLDEIRSGDADPWVIGSLRSEMEDIGIQMPNAKIADVLYNASERAYRAIGDMITHDELPKAINLINELAEWGLDNISIDDFIDLDEDKDDIIKSMLRLMKKNHLNDVRAMLEILDNSMVDWPELEAFRKSIAANKQAKLGEASAGERALLRDPDSYLDNEMLDKVPLARMRPTERGKVPDRGRTFPKIRPDEDMPDEDMVLKDMGDWGVFVLTGHFLKRMKQRKIPTYQVFGVISRVFGDNRDRIKAIPSPSRFTVRDHTGLGIVVDKSTLSNGKTRYSFITAHPKWDASVKDRADESSLLDKPTPTVEELALKHKVSAHDVLRELKKGVGVEQEHTSKLNVAREIALDHLGEDLYYYVKLADAENKDG